MYEYCGYDGGDDDEDHDDYDAPCSTVLMQ